MDFINNIVNKINKRKCDKAWTKVSNLLHDQDKCIITLRTMKGYDKFFKRVTDAGYRIRIDDSMREFVIVTVEKQRSFNNEKEV